MFICNNCGSTEIQEAVWTDPNDSWSVVDCDPPLDRPIWCNNCELHSRDMWDDGEEIPVAPEDLFLSLVPRPNRFWIQADNKVVLIKTMHTAHIKNALAKVLREKWHEPADNERSKWGAVAVIWLQEELRERERTNVSSSPRLSLVNSNSQQEC